MCRTAETDCLLPLASISPQHSDTQIILTFKNLLNFMCLNVSPALVCVCTMWVPGVCTCQKWVSDLLHWSYRWLRTTIQVLGTKPRTSERATRALNHWATALAPNDVFYGHQLTIVQQRAITSFPEAPACSPSAIPIYRPQSKSNQRKPFLWGWNS